MTVLKRILAAILPKPPPLDLQEFNEARKRLHMKSRDLVMEATAFYNMFETDQFGNMVKGMQNRSKTKCQPRSSTKSSPRSKKPGPKKKG